MWLPLLLVVLCSIGTSDVKAEATIDDGPIYVYWSDWRSQVYGRVTLDSGARQRWNFGSANNIYVHGRTVYLSAEESIYTANQDLAGVQVHPLPPPL